MRKNRKTLANDVTDALFNIIDVDKTIKANGLCNIKRVQDGTSNEDTLGDLVEDLVEFLVELDKIYGVNKIGYFKNDS